MRLPESPADDANDDRGAHLPRRLVLALTAGALTASFGVAAQTEDHVRELGELSIKELMELEVDSVFGASRYVQKASRAPSAISVITAEDIKRFGARTLDDVLNSVRGLYVPNDRNYSYLGIRGFQRPNDYNTRVLVLIDGHRMNDNIYDLGSTGREGMVDIDLVERIEVIRGPSSSIYGSSAFFGVINVVTKRGTTLGGFEAGGEAGTFDTFKSRLSYGTTFANGVEWLVSGSRYTSAGQSRLYYAEFDERTSSDPRAANNGIADGNDREDANNFFTSVRSGDFSFSAFRNARVKEVPTASFGTVFNDPREETEDIRSYLDLRYDHRFSGDWSLQARVFYDEYDYSGVYPYDFAAPGDPPDIVLSIDNTVGEWVGAELQLTARVRERHTVIVGGEYRDNRREFQAAHYQLDPLDYYLLDDRSSHTLGIFAQSETDLTDKLLLTAGVRYDRYSTETGDTLNPRLGLIYSPSDTDTLKVLYGEAFRAPNPYERFYYVEQANRPALDAETIHTTELVYEKQLGERYRLTVAGYVYHVRDLLSQAATDAGDIYFDNLDSARAKGFEIEIDRQFASGAALRASYARQKAVDGLTDVELSSSPRDLAKLNLSLPFARDRLNAGFEVRYHGSVWTLRGNRVDDFVTANVTLFSRATGGLELSGTVYNVFDERYSYPGAEDHLQDALEQNGRMLQGKLTYRF